MNALRKGGYVQQFVPAHKVHRAVLDRLSAERGDAEDVHVSTLLILAHALQTTVNDILRDCKYEHEDGKRE